MHAWGAVDLRIYLAQKNHGYSISAQSYDFCPHLAHLNTLDFTLSHNSSRSAKLYQILWLNLEEMPAVLFKFSRPLTDPSKIIPCLPVGRPDHD